MFNSRYISSTGASTNFTLEILELETLTYTVFGDKEFTRLASLGGEVINPISGSFGVTDILLL